MSSACISSGPFSIGPKMFCCSPLTPAGTHVLPADGVGRRSQRTCRLGSRSSDESGVEWHDHPKSRRC